MSLNYDNFRFYCAVVTEKTFKILSMLRYQTLPLEF